MSSVSLENIIQQLLCLRYMPIFFFRFQDNFLKNATKQSSVSVFFFLDLKVSSTLKA